MFTVSKFIYIWHCYCKKRNTIDMEYRYNVQLYTVQFYICSHILCTFILFTYIDVYRQNRNVCLNGDNTEAEENKLNPFFNWKTVIKAEEELQEEFFL